MECHNQIEYWKRRAIHAERRLVEAERFKIDYKNLAEKNAFLLEILIDSHEKQRQPENKSKKTYSRRMHVITK